MGNNGVFLQVNQHVDIQKTSVKYMYSISPISIREIELKMT